MGATDRPTWPLNAASKIDAAREVAQRVSADFNAGTISEIVLISPKLVSMLSQRPETRKLVPVVADDLAALEGDRAPAPEGPRGSVEFAPSPEFVLSRLLPKYLEFTIYSSMLETDAAFFAAQLIAMNNATDNASKLIDELTIQMNNARQAAITKELLEIVAGAEALGA
jgi:F-type H+-transporting ATPase subunit gamma